MSELSHYRVIKWLLLAAGLVRMCGDRSNIIICSLFFQNNLEEVRNRAQISGHPTVRSSDSLHFHVDANSTGLEKPSDRDSGFVTCAGDAQVSSGHQGAPIGLSLILQTMQIIFSGNCATRKGTTT